MIHDYITCMFLNVPQIWRFMHSEVSVTHARTHAHTYTHTNTHIHVPDYHCLYHISIKNNDGRLLTVIAKLSRVWYREGGALGFLPSQHSDNYDAIVAKQGLMTVRSIKASLHMAVMSYLHQAIAPTLFPLLVGNFDEIDNTLILCPRTSTTFRANLQKLTHPTQHLYQQHLHRHQSNLLWSPNSFPLLTHHNDKNLTK